MLHTWGNHEYEMPLSLSHQKTAMTGSMGHPKGSCNTSPSLLNMRAVHVTEKHVLKNSS